MGGTLQAPEEEPDRGGEGKPGKVALFRVPLCKRPCGSAHSGARAGSTRHVIALSASPALTCAAILLTLRIEHTGHDPVPRHPCVA